MAAGAIPLSLRSVPGPESQSRWGWPPALENGRGRKGVGVAAVDVVRKATRRLFRSSRFGCATRKWDECTTPPSPFDSRCHGGPGRKMSAGPLVRFLSPHPREARCPGRVEDSAATWRTDAHPPCQKERRRLLGPSLMLSFMPADRATTGKARPACDPCGTRVGSRSRSRGWPASRVSPPIVPVSNAPNRHKKLWVSQILSPRCSDRRPYLCGLWRGRFGQL